MKNSSIIITVWSVKIIDIVTTMMMIEQNLFIIIINI